MGDTRSCRSFCRDCQPTIQHHSKQVWRRRYQSYGLINDFHPQERGRVAVHQIPSELHPCLAATQYSDGGKTGRRSRQPLRNQCLLSARWFTESWRSIRTPCGLCRNQCQYCQERSATQDRPQPVQSPTQYVFSYRMGYRYRLYGTRRTSYSHCGAQSQHPHFPMGCTLQGQPPTKSIYRYSEITAKLCSR